MAAGMGTKLKTTFSSIFVAAQIGRANTVPRGSLETSLPITKN